MKLNRRSFAQITLLAGLLSLTACKESTTKAPAPGYSGGVPSGNGQQALRDLQGQTVQCKGATWTVGGFSVTPRYDSAGRPGDKTPHVTLTKGKTVQQIDVFSDGDVADFYLRVTGKPHPNLNAKTTDEYAAQWK